MIFVRMSKTALVAVVALFFTVVAFGNATDYDFQLAVREACPFNGHHLPGLDADLESDQR